MIPVDMRSMHNPPHSAGDCHAACIASLLEIDIQDVPAPTVADVENISGYWRRLGEFLRAKGLFLLKFEPNKSGMWSTLTVSDDDAPDDEYWIACGKTVRGDTLHCVVCKGSEVVHDPHPSRAGLLAVDTVEYLVPLDPRQALKQRFVDRIEALG